MQESPVGAILFLAIILLLAMFYSALDLSRKKTQKSRSGLASKKRLDNI